MRKIAALFIVMMLIQSFPRAYAATYTVNETGSDYSFEFREVFSTSETQYFLIEGSKDMEIRISVGVEGTIPDRADVSLYLVEGNYHLPDGLTEPEDYDIWHSHPEPTVYFATSFIMAHATVYTLLAIPNGTSSFKVEVYGENNAASFGTSSGVCLGLMLVAAAIFLYISGYTV